MIVVFRELPEEPDNCLVVEYDSLPDRYHDRVINLVESPEAQGTVDLQDVLNTHVFPDGSGNMLMALHHGGYLRKIDIDSVLLIPASGRTLDLRLANEAIAASSGKVAEAESVSESVLDGSVGVDVVGDVVTDDEVGTDDVIGDVSDVTAIAEKLLVEANMLVSTAKRKREQAYEMAPELKPTTKIGRPELSDAEKALADRKRKDKRNARDRARRAEAKVAKKTQAIEAAAADKVARDAARQ